MKAPFQPLFPKETRKELRALKDEFDQLRIAHGERIERMKSYRQEAEAARYSSTGLRQSEDYGRKNASKTEDTREDISLPFAQAITLKHANQLSSKLPDAVVERREETAEERYRSDTMEKMWWGIVGASGGDTTFAGGAWDGSQLGSTCFEIYFDIDKQMPIFRTVDPTTILQVSGLDDVHNFSRVYRFWDVPVATLKAEYSNKNFRDQPVEHGEIESTHKQGDVEMCTVVQKIDKQGVIRFTLGGLVPLYEHQHNLGFVNYVVIPNVGPDRDIWGWADYEFYRNVSQYIQRLLSREADIIKLVSNGAMTLQGASGMDPAKVLSALKTGGIIPIKKDASLDPVQVPEIPAFEINHAERAMELMKMLSFTPDAAWGDGAAGSGSDRGLQLRPGLELTGMKQTNWSAGLSRLAKMAFLMIERKQVSTAVYHGAVRRGGQAQKSFASFKFGPEEAPLHQTISGEDGVEDEVILPRTPAELFAGDYSVYFNWQNRIDPDDPGYVMSEINKFQNGMQSLRTTLERMGVKNPEDEIKLIQEEAEKMPWLRNGSIALVKAELQAAQQQSGQGAGGGAPPTQGGGLLDALGMMGSKDGAALDGDAGASAAQQGVGAPYGAA